MRIAGELDEGNVVFVVADDGWKYLSSGIYTLPVDEIENFDSTVWWCSWVRIAQDPVWMS